MRNERLTDFWSATAYDDERGYVEARYNPDRRLHWQSDGVTLTIPLAVPVHVAKALMHKLQLKYLTRKGGY